MISALRSLHDVITRKYFCSLLVRMTSPAQITHSLHASGPSHVCMRPGQSPDVLS